MISYLQTSRQLNRQIVNVASKTNDRKTFHFYVKAKYITFLFFVHHFQFKHHANKKRHSGSVVELIFLQLYGEINGKSI